VYRWSANTPEYGSLPFPAHRPALRRIPPSTSWRGRSRRGDRRSSSRRWRWRGKRRRHSVRSSPVRPVNRARISERGVKPERWKQGSVRCDSRASGLSVRRAVDTSSPMTPCSSRCAARRGARWSYQQAAVVLGKVRGVRLAAETVRRIVAATGHTVAHQYRQRAMRGDAHPVAATAVCRHRAWHHPFCAAGHSGD